MWIMEQRRNGGIILRDCSSVAVYVYFCLFLCVRVCVYSQLVTSSSATEKLRMCEHVQTNEWVYVLLRGVHYECVLCASSCLPGKVLFILSLLPGLSGLGHVCPVGKWLEQATDVLVFRPGSTDGQLLLALDDSPEETHVHTTQQITFITVCCCPEQTERESWLCWLCFNISDILEIRPNVNRLVRRRRLAPLWCIASAILFDPKMRRMPQKPGKEPSYSVTASFR